MEIDSTKEMNNNESSTIDIEMDDAKTTKKRSGDDRLLDEEVSSRQIHSPPNVARFLSSEYELEKQEDDIRFVRTYDEPTSLAAADLYYNSKHYASEVPKKAMIMALSKRGIPPHILRDTSLVKRLHNIVRTKMGWFKRNDSTAKKRKDRSNDSNKNDPPRSREERILEATQLANRMACPGKEGVFRANICIVCDCHIIGTEKICYLTKDELLKNDHRIGLESYNDYYTKASNGGYSELLQESELVKQYTVDGMEGLLLSRRSCHTIESGIDTYEACQSCHESITKRFRNKSPPKFAIANGYVIGQIPGVIEI